MKFIYVIPHACLRASLRAALLAVLIIGANIQDIQAQPNAIGIAQQTFKNVSGANANDFDAVFNVPAVGLGQDVATATKYPYATGQAASHHFILNPVIGNNQNFQLTYSPGSIPFVVNENLKSATFTLNGNPVNTRSVPLIDLLLFSPGENSSEVMASNQFINETNDQLVLITLNAYRDIPDQFFTPDDFASASAISSGTRVDSFPASLPLPGNGSSPLLDLGPLLLGNYDLVTGTAFRSSNATEVFPFAFAALPEPVPEPFSIAILGTALTGLGLVRFWRRNLL